MKLHPKVTVQAVQILLGERARPQGYIQHKSHEKEGVELETDNSHYWPEGGATPRNAEFSGLDVRVP